MISDLESVNNNKPFLVLSHAPCAHILALRICEGAIEEGRSVPYSALTGDRFIEMGWVNDKLVERGFSVANAIFLERQGDKIGTLIREQDVESIRLNESLASTTLDMRIAMNPKTYAITSKDDSHYFSGKMPIAVFQKSKPINMAEPNNELLIEHELYLQFPTPLQENCRYHIAFPELGLSRMDLTIEFDSFKQNSEAIHVSQIGFCPEEPVKKGFLSFWLGTGGPLEYAKDLTFSVLDTVSQSSVYEGSVHLVKSQSNQQNIPTIHDYCQTYVYELDFSALTVPGQYRLQIDGTGCSEPFQIKNDVWLKAFRGSMKGLYHQRSGIEIGPPYSGYTHPRSYHPDDGLVVYHSDTPIMFSGNGLNALGTDPNNFTNLVAGKTARLVSNAWGGTFDAGDWDRRIEHLVSTRYLVELIDLFPSFFDDCPLNIPETGNGLPDALNEGLWNLDFYQRLQSPEGGVRGGIEAEEHPRVGETSWNDSLQVYSYAPCMWSSYIYCGVAARTAHWLVRYKPERSAHYTQSALKAMVWAEEQRCSTDFSAWTCSAKQRLDEERNLAAIELYRLTGDGYWHQIYEETLSALHRDSDFVYLRLEETLVKEPFMCQARERIMASASKCLAFSQGNAFHLTTWTDNPKPGYYNGFFSCPEGAIPLVRAHYLTGDIKYMEEILQACQFGAGANPLNLCYTTGLGCRSPRNPLHLDSRRTNQPVPSGLTVYGCFDPAAHPDDPTVALIHARNACVPDILTWPAAESYFDIYLFPPVTEWTIHQTQAPNNYVWGYLAAAT